MSTEEMVKAVGYLRSAGGYFLTIEPTSDGIVCIGSFKDVGSYSSTVSYATAGHDLEEVQSACIVGLAKLVKYTEKSKPDQTKPAAAAPTGGAVITLKGLKDDAFTKGKDIIKSAGFHFDKDSKDWIGGDVNKLPDWLKKRVKGAAPKAFSKPAPVESYDSEPEVEADDFGGDLDSIPF